MFASGTKTKMSGNDHFGRHCGQFSIGHGIGILSVKKTCCARGVPRCLYDEFAFDWAWFEGQQPTKRGSQVVHIFILYSICIESWCRIVQSKLRRRGRIRRIFLAKKPLLFGITTVFPVPPGILPYSGPLLFRWCTLLITADRRAPRSLALHIQCCSLFIVSLFVS
jgi:hypothetical protein